MKFEDAFCPHMVAVKCNDEWICASMFEWPTRDIDKQSDRDFPNGVKNAGLLPVACN